jgi:hypothetical protein
MADGHRRHAIQHSTPLGSVVQSVSQVPCTDPTLKSQLINWTRVIDNGKPLMDDRKTASQFRLEDHTARVPAPACADGMPSSSFQFSPRLKGRDWAGLEAQRHARR